MADMDDALFVPLATYREYPEAEMRRRAREFYAEARRRRSVRSFSDRPVAREVIEDCLRAAGTAPSGAHQQPWHFVVVSDAEMKHRIREEAEKVEHAFYHERAVSEWLAAIAPMGTNELKPYLEIAPYLIVIFAISYGEGAGNERAKHYYVTESVGIATGMLITALHHAGLVSLTHTPSPMGFLNTALNRPSNERPFLLLAVGYPADDATVPALERKPLDEIASFI
jgi:iodotyrosine deiodinase